MGCWESQNGPMRRIKGHRSDWALLLAIAVAASGCGQTASSATTSATHAGPSPTASARTSVATGSIAESNAAVFATIEAQVAALRGLPTRTPVTPVLLDPTALRDKLTAIDAAQTDHVALAAEGRLLTHMGLLPEGSSLEQLELDLEAGQVVGFYDPSSKGLYVLSDSGGVGAVEKVTFAHEYTHALQDQSFGLDKLATDTPDQSDRDLARTALPEGDATLAMSLWSEKNLSLAELFQIAAMSMTPVSSDQLASAPEILRDTLLFPYTQGLAFVQAAYLDGGWSAVDKLYANPPDSTSQILHPELYAAGVKPVALNLPVIPAAMGSSWKLAMQDTLGEFELGIWLAGDGASDVQKTAAAAAVASWAGDRVGLYEGPNGAWAVVLRTQWRPEAGAGAAFNAAADKRLAVLAYPSSTCGDPTHEEIVIASDMAVIPSFSDCKSWP